MNAERWKLEGSVQTRSQWWSVRYPRSGIDPHQRSRRVHIRRLASAPPSKPQVERTKHVMTRHISNPHTRPQSRVFPRLARFGPGLICVRSHDGDLHWWTASDPRYKPHTRTAVRSFTGFPSAPPIFEVPPWLPSKQGGTYTSSKSSYIVVPLEIPTNGS
jgi:hypothetical protein